MSVDLACYAGSLSTWRHERRFPFGGELASFLWRTCGPAYSERVANAFEAFYESLVTDARRSFRTHAMTDRTLHTDELRCLARIAGLQADYRPLIEAVVCWFTPSGALGRGLLNKAGLLAHWLARAGHAVTLTPHLGGPPKSRLLLCSPHPEMARMGNPEAIGRRPHA